MNRTPALALICLVFGFSAVLLSHHSPATDTAPTTVVEQHATLPSPAVAGSEVGRVPDWVAGVMAQRAPAAAAKAKTKTAPAAGSGGGHCYEDQPCWDPATMGNGVGHL